jgi:hypothetical protein
MNQVRLSGFIIDEIDLRRRGDGTEAATVSFRFSQGCGPITLLCFGTNTRHVARFKPGDAVTILGRLIVGRHNGKAAVLVDEAHSLNQEDESPEQRERALSVAIHRFNAHAVVVGVRK